MKSLSTDQVLKEKQTHDPDSIRELSLTHRALSDVSCLSEFKNLERLDLRFNNLTSLEGLKSCFNLKWLSVAQNKLESLKGIEGLSKLAVLNAGKNKLKSMDEVRALVSLRALILNDNEIPTICKLDQLKDLNTLVLSRNPISKIGESLAKTKNLSKISLSNCKIHDIGSSLKSCTELKELRLTHNEITVLPAELALNKKLLNLDLGNNVIMRWSDLKVLDSLLSLRNLNLHGNPIAENEKLAKKVIKVLPGLRIFNSKPVNKRTKMEKIDQADDPLIEAFDRSDDKTRKDHTDKKRSKEHNNIPGTGNDSDVNKGTKAKRKKGNEKPSKKEPAVNEEDDDAVKKKQKRIKPKEELDIIDDGEVSFAELFAREALEIREDDDGGKKTVERVVRDKSLAGGMITYPSKKNKGNRNKNKDLGIQLLPEFEIGMGGPSTWVDEL